MNCCDVGSFGPKRLKLEQDNSLRYVHVTMFVYTCVSGSGNKGAPKTIHISTELVSVIVFIRVGVRDFKVN